MRVLDEEDQDCPIILDDKDSSCIFEVHVVMEFRCVEFNNLQRYQTEGLK